MSSDILQKIKPRTYQELIFAKCSEKNCLVVLPTGLGKTLIALMLVIDRMKKFPKEKILFLAPTRPLAEQHLEYFRKNLPDLWGEMVLFTGKVNASQRKKIWQNSDIIFSTPQCIANDLRNNLYDLKKVSLLIEDEAHRCIKNYDYTFVAKKYHEEAINERILGLTASPGSEKEKIKEICKNLFIEEVELRTRDSEDVKPYLQELEFEKIAVSFPVEFEELRNTLKKIYLEYVDELKSRNVLYGPVNKITLLELQKKISRGLSLNNKNFNYMIAASACANAIKLQHALELLETQTLASFSNYLKKLVNEAENKKSRGIQKLVNKPEFNYAYSHTVELIQKGIEHPKLEKLSEIIKDEIDNNPQSKSIIFTQFRDTALVISKKLSDIRLISPKIFVGQAKKISNEGKKSTGLNQKEQKAIIDEFSNGNINCLIATSIGEEGLDIPEVNSVIFYEAVPSAIRKIQRAGRTARLMKGKLIILIAKNTRDEAFYYASRSREKRMHSAISSIKEELNNEKIKKIKTEEKQTFLNLE